MKPLNFYIVIFFLFSFLGWITEVVLKYFQFHRFINRGFLIGPYCPIYGLGVVILTLLEELFSPLGSSIGTGFLTAVIACGILEYITSYIFEKRFKARWWDYSDKPMNLHGRVWIGNLILFGIFGLVITRFFNPLIYRIYLNSFDKLIKTSIYILSFLFMLDFVFSHFIMELLKKGIEQSTSDRSEEIALEIRELFKDKNLLYKRIISSYPEVQFRTKRVKERIKKDREYIHQLADNKRDELDMLIKNKKDIASKNLILSRTIQKDIIEKQNELIEGLVRGSLSKEDIEIYRRDIDEMKKLLEKRHIKL
ncbi:MAG: hypothetical protein Q4E02_04695 [Lagierella massiliensis]|nr:hypothetical protein [Lagierella massiliensis]